MVQWDHNDDIRTSYRSCLKEISPKNGIEKRIQYSGLIVLFNYQDIHSTIHRGFSGEIEPTEIDKCLKSNLIPIPENKHETYSKSNIFKYIHNLLSALYSYNEQIFNILCDNTKYEKDDFLKYDINESLGSIPDYIVKSSFLRGVRNDIQHQDYKCIKCRPADNKSVSFVDESCSFYKIEFKKGLFNPDENSVYIKNVDDEDVKHILSYMSVFFTNNFFEFHERICDNIPSLSSPNEYV